MRRLVPVLMSLLLLLMGVDSHMATWRLTKSRSKSCWISWPKPDLVLNQLVLPDTAMRETNLSHNL